MTLTLFFFYLISIKRRNEFLNKQLKKNCSRALFGEIVCGQDFYEFLLMKMKKLKGRIFSEKKNVN